MSQPGEEGERLHRGHLASLALAVPRLLNWAGEHLPHPAVPTGWCCFRDALANGHSFAKAVEAYTVLIIKLIHCVWVGENLP